MAGWDHFARFVTEVQEAKKRLGLRPHQECFFRGHSDATYRLLPSLFRLGLRDFGKYWQAERRAFFEFRTRARQLYEQEHTDWDVLFFMQHHGLPTRLLDWSSVLGVALYFSLQDYEEGSIHPPCIWLLNPYALNKATWNVARLINPRYLAREEQLNRSYDYSEVLLGTRPPHWGDKRLSWESPLAIYSPQRSDRMFAQSGWFTIHGTDIRPIDEIFSNRQDILQKVELPIPAIKGAEQFLNMAGIDDRVMFPDLDGLSRSISKRLGMKKRNERRDHQSHVIDFGPSPDFPLDHV